MVGKWLAEDLDIVEKHDDTVQEFRGLSQERVDPSCLIDDHDSDGEILGEEVLTVHCP
jgi:hypothetical protein